MDSSRIPEEVLDAIRSRVSILDVVGTHVALKRAGKNWKGLCPFHGEKTPSFVVNEERGAYHCFGCGAGGSIFRFVMEAEGRSFREAVEALAARAGVQLRLGPEGAEERQAREEKDLLLDILELAARYYRHQLLEGRAGARARAYLERREIGDQPSEAFRLGCAPDAWDALARYLRRKGVDLGLAARAGLVAERSSGGYYDRLRDRLVFPIADASGRVVSFGGRVLGTGEPKYLNGPESPVFRKSEVLYGLSQARDALRREKRAILVEGYIDVVSLHGRGYAAALATLGTSLTPQHVQALRRRVDEVVVVYDGDEAGRKAAFRSLDLFLAGGLPCRVALLPEEHDPDTFVRSGGDLDAEVRDARPLMDAYLDELGHRFDLGTVEGRLGAAESVLPALGAVGDPLARGLYVRRVAETLGVPESDLRRRLDQGPTPSRPADASSLPVREADPLERGLLACLVHEPEHRPAFLSRGLESWMRPGAVRDACRFVAERSEPASSLPLDAAPEAFRGLLAEILVHEGPPRASFEALESALGLRDLEARAARLVSEMRQAENRGDQAAVERLQKEKMGLDRAAMECRRR